jgi:hypothetical protein
MDGFGLLMAVAGKAGWRRERKTADNNNNNNNSNNNNNNNNNTLTRSGNCHSPQSAPLIAAKRSGALEFRSCPLLFVLLCLRTSVHDNVGGF